MPSPIVSYRSNTSVGFYLARVHTSADERCTHHWPKVIDPRGHEVAPVWFEPAGEGKGSCGHLRT